MFDRAIAYSIEVKPGSEEALAAIAARTPDEFTLSLAPKRWSKRVKSPEKKKSKKEINLSIY